MKAWKRLFMAMVMVSLLSANIVPVALAANEDSTSQEVVEEVQDNGDNEEVYEFLKDDSDKLANELDAVIERAKGNFMLKVGLMVTDFAKNTIIPVVLISIVIGFILIAVSGLNKSYYRLGWCLVLGVPAIWLFLVFGLSAIISAWLY